MSTLLLAIQRSLSFLFDKPEAAFTNLAHRKEQQNTSTANVDETNVDKANADETDVDEANVDEDAGVDEDVGVDEDAGVDEGAGVDEDPFEDICNAICAILDDLGTFIQWWILHVDGAVVIEQHNTFGETFNILQSFRQSGTYKKPEGYEQNGVAETNQIKERLHRVQAEILAKRETGNDNMNTPFLELYAEVMVSVFDFGLQAEEAKTVTPEGSGGTLALYQTLLERNRELREDIERSKIENDRVGKSKGGM